MQTGDAHSLPPANLRSLHSFVISRLLCKWTIGVTFALSLLLDPDPGGAVSICAWFFFFFLLLSGFPFLPPTIYFILLTNSVLFFVYHFTERILSYSSTRLHCAAWV